MLNISIHEEISELFSIRKKEIYKNFPEKFFISSFSRIIIYSSFLQGIFTVNDSFSVSIVKNLKGEDNLLFSLEIEENDRKVLVIENINKSIYSLKKFIFSFLKGYSNIELLKENLFLEIFNFQENEKKIDLIIQEIKNNKLSFEESEKTLFLFLFSLQDLTLFTNTITDLNDSKSWERVKNSIINFKGSNNDLIKFISFPCELKEFSPCLKCSSCSINQKYNKYITSEKKDLFKCQFTSQYIRCEDCQYCSLYSSGNLKEESIYNLIYFSWNKNFSDQIYCSLFDFFDNVEEVFLIKNKEFTFSKEFFLSEVEHFEIFKEKIMNVFEVSNHCNSKFTSLFRSLPSFQRRFSLQVLNDSASFNNDVSPYFIYKIDVNNLYCSLQIHEILEKISKLFSIDILLEQNKTICLFDKNLNNLEKKINNLFFIENDREEFFSLLINARERLFVEIFELSEKYLNFLKKYDESENIPLNLATISWYNPFVEKFMNILLEFNQLIEIEEFFSTQSLNKKIFLFKGGISRISELQNSERFEKFFSDSPKELKNELEFLQNLESNLGKLINYISRNIFIYSINKNEEFIINSDKLSNFLLSIIKFSESSTFFSEIIRDRLKINNDNILNYLKNFTDLLLIDFSDIITNQIN